jgi:UDP-glucose:(heptosyl)LPS alpha-1,3-glucosyltransferase
LAAGLVGRGHRVSLVATSFNDVPDGVATVPVAADGATRVGRYERFLSGVQAATAGFDVVHAMLPVRRCDLYHPHAGVAAEAVAAAGWAGRMNRRRVRFAQVERDLVTAATPPAVLCLSGLIRAAVVRHYPTLGNDRLVTLFNGTDLARFDPDSDAEARQRVRRQFSIADGQPVGLMLAQDFARKGLSQAIQALRSVPGWTLLVGGRDDPAPYRRSAEKLGVTDRLTFAGNVADPAAFYRAADFFVLPTKHDPCSLVVLEALAMGVPVISTRQNGACEVMVDGVHGRVLPSPDVGLADAVRDVIGRREVMSAACVALRPALSQEHHLDAVERAYAGRVNPAR